MPGWTKKGQLPAVCAIAAVSQCLKVTSPGTTLSLTRVLGSVWPEDAIRSGRERHVPADMTGGPTPNPYNG